MPNREKAHKASLGLARLMAAALAAGASGVDFDKYPHLVYDINREVGPLLDSANAKIEAAKARNKAVAEAKRAQKSCRCYGCVTMRYPCVNN
jgi:hypothetical protein